MNILDMVRLGVSGFKPADIKKINESGINSDDIISLAKNGYSAADVNELISMASQEAEKVQPGHDERADQQGPADPSGHEGDKEAEYIEKLKAQEAELEKMKKTLEAVQNQNSQRNLGGTEPQDSLEKVHEIFKTLY